MSEGNKDIIRFSILERIEHFVLILSFTTLAVTGLSQKYALLPISQAIIRFFGGIDSIRIIHHIAAAVFLLEAVYHIVIVGYKLFVQRKQATMLPGIKDATDIVQWFGHNLGFVKEAPKMPRYNFGEKMEYLAMLWGLVLMGLTGLMLWNPIATTNILPGEFIPAAKAAHGAEAILAVLAIILWHFYNVHLKHWNWGMIKGTISREQMEEEHGEELEQMETGRLPQPPAAAVYRQRFMLFLPVAAIISLVLVGLTYYFLTFEKTSITTVPPAENVAVYAPVTPTPTPTEAPTPTAAPAALQQSGSASSVAWTGTIDTLLKDNCASCHAASSSFDATSYTGVMKMVTASDAEGSKIVQVQKTGNHPAELSAADLKTLVDWIQAGAPETAGSGSSAQPAAGAAAGSSGETWSTGISDLFKNTCGSCHGDAGGFAATTYDDVMKQVTAGNPDASKVVEIQKAGGHYAEFTADELNRVIEWIKSGAPK